MNPLNKSQKASLTAALSCLEEAIMSIKDVCGDNTEGHLFIEYVNGLPLDKKDEISTELDLMLDVAEDLKKKFQLEVDTIDVRRRILSEISTTWEYLHDSKARSLRRYGEVSSNLEDHLDPDIEKLIHSIERIRKIVGTN